MSTTSPAFVLTNDSITVHFSTGALTITLNSPRFGEAREHILAGRWDDAKACMSIKAGMAQWSNGDFIIKGDDITYKGEKLPRDLHNRILGMYKEGKQTFTHLLNFWERLQLNPSYRSVHQLYSFLKNGNVPIGPDGCFYAYKSVRGDLKDHHTGDYDNSPGVTNRMPRNKVSDDPNQTCHEGFHVGNTGYVKSFNAGNSKNTVNKIDPANVVCVPSDANAGKMRVCEYASIGLWTGKPLPNLVWDPASDTSGEYITKYKPAQGMSVVGGLPLVGPSKSIGQKATPPIDTLREPEVPTQKFDVILLKGGNRMIEVIKTIRATLDLGLAESKEMFENAPVMVVGKVPQQSAMDFKAKLEAAGAEADYYSTGIWTAPEKPKEEVKPVEVKPEPVTAPAVANQPAVRVVFTDSLDTMTLDALRAHAKTLGIKNIKDIRGGKEALIKVIRDLKPASAVVPAGISTVPAPAMLALPAPVVASPAATAVVVSCNDEFATMSRDKMRPIAKLNGVPKWGSAGPNELREALRALVKAGTLKR